MSVIEAAALGCFPLLSDIPAHRQLIAEGKYYFQLDNPQELVEKIKSVINGWRQGESVKGIGGGLESYCCTIRESAPRCFKKYKRTTQHIRNGIGTCRKCLKDYYL